MEAARTAVPPPAELERLLRLLGELAEGEEPDSRPAALHGEPRGQEWPPPASLRTEDEQVVADLKAGLARLAGSRPSGTDHAAEAVEAALDGAEFVTRLHLLGGLGVGLPQLLPSLVYLVVSPRSGRLRAISEARRAALLLQDA
jgi:hypothetical protein